MSNDVRIIPLSESAFVVEFGRTISIDSNRKAIALANSLNSLPFPGLIEAAPAYASTCVYVDVPKLNAAFPEYEPYRLISDKVRDRLSGLTLDTDDGDAETLEIEFTVDDGKFDLEYVAERTSMTRESVIEKFVSLEYRVYMLGFLPGFPYMGILDERLVLPRRSVPRSHVPAGSVAIAGQQVGIYPQESPGGWHIIGRTEFAPFDSVNLAPLRPGVNVRFVAV